MQYTSKTWASYVCYAFLPYARSMVLWSSCMDYRRWNQEVEKNSWVEGWFSNGVILEQRKLVPTPGLEPGTPWCLLRRCFFQLQSGALPTELSEVVRATASFYLFSSSLTKPEINKGRGSFGYWMRPQKSTILPLLEARMLIVGTEGSPNQEV